MSEITDGLAYIKELREKNHKEAQSFSDFSRYLEQRAREQGVPLNGQFELTPLCNFNCGMCYVHLTDAQMDRPLMKPEEWNKLISQACQAGMISATLTGGECLAYPGFRKVYEHLQSLGCEIDVYTNGALLDEKWIEYFVSRPPAGIHITLYGDSEEAYQRVTGQNAFETVVKHLRAVNDAKLPLRINVTPNRALGEDVFGTIRLARELCRNVTVNAQLSIPRKETGRAEPDIDPEEELYIRIVKFQHELDGIVLKTCPAEALPTEGGPDCSSILHGLQCGGGRSCFAITWKGTMVPCNDLEMIRAYPLETGFEQAWHHINEQANQWPRSSACEGCAYESVCVSCAGRVMNYAEPGTWPKALCERTKRFVQQGVYEIPECE